VKDINFKPKKPMRNFTLQPLLKLPCFFLMAGTMAMAGISGDATASEASKPPAVAQARTSGQENKGAASEWKDPEKVLPEVFYDGVPVTDAGEDLRKKFDGEFDVLFPKSGWEGDSWDWKQKGRRMPATRSALGEPQTKSVSSLKVETYGLTIF
jgi:hypothetical protein